MIHCKLAYKNRKNAGTATVTITGIGKYGSSVRKTFTIKKAANPMTVTTKSLTANASTKTTIKKSKAFNVSREKGKVTFNKISGNSRITVASNGTLTVKKGLTRGVIYSVKVKVTAAGNANYKERSKTVMLNIKIK